MTVRPWIVATILTLILILSFANFYKYGFFSSSSLARNKDAISAVSSATTAFLAFLAACVAYLRFFRGRLLSVRADVVPTVTVIPGPKGMLLHVVAVEVTNVGSIALLEPTVSVEALGRTGDPDAALTTIGLSQSPIYSTFEDGRQRDFQVIDSGERAFFFFEHFFDKSIWAVTYKVVFKSQSLGSWVSGITVANEKQGI